MAKIKITLKKEYDGKIFEFGEKNDEVWRIDNWGYYKILVISTNTDCVTIPIDRIKSITFEEDQDVSVNCGGRK